MKLSFKLAALILLCLLLGIFLTSFVILPLTINLTSVLKVFIILVLVITPIALMVWFFIHKLILVPILKLNKVATIIAKGNLGIRAETKSEDEIGELAQNFNIVVNNLTSSLQYMAHSLRDEKLKEEELAVSYRELDKEKAQDEALLSSIGDAVIAIDIQQKIILFNNAASKMTGIDPKNAIGQPYSLILRFFDESTKAPAEDFIIKSLMGRSQPSNSRIMLQRFSDEMLPVLHTTSPIFSNQKQIVGVVVTLKDITRERELEKLKDEFVSLASHELRTPMTAIKGLISMILEGDYGNVNEDLKDPLSDVSRSTERLIQLVNDMLDVSRIEAGRTKTILTKVSIPELVTEITGMLKQLADQKNIHLEVSGSDINKVMADADKVKQILINLVNNAIKFTDHGSVIISYQSRKKFAYISVTDSGIGLSKEDQPKLFEKFSQISNFQSGRPPGTGLGLYLSREFAKMMGGDLWIERSEIGKGSTFAFVLPFADHVI